MRRLRYFLAFAYIASAALGSSVARADSVSDFYKGKVVSIIVGFSTGGIYDIWARLVAQHLPKHIPGMPNVVVQNVPGAGGLTAINNVYNTAPQDGTVIAATSNLNPFTPLLDIKEARFDATKFQWLGSPTQDVALLLLRNTVPVDNLNDLRNHEVVLGSTSPDSASSFYGRLIAEIFKSKFKFVYGFPGLADTDLAIERGEVDGHPSVFWSHLVAAKPDWLKDKKVKLLLQYGAKPRPELPDVPYAQTLPMNAADKQLLDVSMAPLALGYPYLMGPRVPPERAAALRQALTDTFADPDFVAAAKVQGLEVDPVSAVEMQKTAAVAYGAPKTVVDRLLALYATPR
jgi:tripartite-type tricarboxylate transporter receptor subunit TctC